MRIKAKCNTCGRNFLLSQIGAESDAPGRCPFCGARFARHYTSSLVDSVQASELAAARFVHALGHLQSIETGFEIDLDGLLASLSEQVRGHEQQRSAS